MNSKFVSLDSVDREETEEFATSVFCPHKFHLARSERKLHTKISSASLSSVGVSNTTFGAKVTVEPGTLDEFYLVQASVDGAIDVLSGNQRCLSTPGIATVLSPNQYTRMEWDKAGEFFTVRIDRRSLENQLSSLTGELLQGPLVFDLEMDLQRDRSRPWQSVVQAVYDHISYSDWLPNDPVTSDALERSLMTTLLQTQPHNYSDQLDKSLPRHASALVRRAIQFMAQHLAENLSNQKVAAAVGSTERSLLNHFRKHTGSTPKQYLLELRLRTTRTRLLAAGSDTSITQVFSDAGIRHHGRFSGLYKARFGESPSATMKKVRCHEDS